MKKQTLASKVAQQKRNAKNKKNGKLQIRKNEVMPILRK